MNNLNNNSYQEHVQGGEA